MPLSLCYIIFLLSHADFDGDGGDHVVGIPAVEVLDDEGHLAFLPLETDVFGNGIIVPAAVVVLLMDLDGDDEGERVPGTEVVLGVIDVVYVGLDGPVLHDVGGDVGILEGGIEIVVCPGEELSLVAEPMTGIDGVLVGVDFHPRVILDGVVLFGASRCHRRDGQHGKE